MKNILNLLFVLTVFTSCAVKLESDPIAVDPIQVDLGLNLDKIPDYYLVTCQNEYDKYALTVTIPEDEVIWIENCLDKKQADFLDVFSFVTN